MAKNGLPPVLSCIRCGEGPGALAGAAQGIGAGARPTSSSRSGASRISRTRSAPGAAISCSATVSGWAAVDLVVAVGADQQRDAAPPAARPDAAAARAWPQSSHCRSSRNRTSGCSGRAKTPTKRRNTVWKRFCASCGGSSGSGGCFPMTSSSSGTRLTMSWPFGPSASRRRRASAPSSCVTLAEDERIRPWKAWARVDVRDVALVLVELCRLRTAPRVGTSALCSSLTTDDLPMPE